MSHLPLLLQRMADWEKIWGKGLSEVSVGESRMWVRVGCG